MLTWSNSPSPEDATTFLGLFPEFGTADPVMGAAMLLKADAMVSDGWIGKQRDLVVGLTCADALALSPAGRAARLADRDGTSTYGRRLEKMKRAHACGFHRQG